MAAISPLRRRMIEDMTVRNLSPATQRSYIFAVAKFSRHFGCSPDRLGLDDVRAFQVHLVPTGISWPALNQIVCDLLGYLERNQSALVPNAARRGGRSRHRRNLPGPVRRDRRAFGSGLRRGPGPPSALAAMRQGGPPASASLNGSRRPVPTIVFHGDRDTTVSPVNGDQVIAQSKAGADLRTTVNRGQSEGGTAYTRTVQADEGGRPILEQWVLHGTGHAWSGGSQTGSYTDPRGPDASREMLRFFFAHRRSDTAGPA